MTKTRFRFKNTTVKNRILKNKPVWLLKWTHEGSLISKERKLKLQKQGYDD